MNEPHDHFEYGCSIVFVFVLSIAAMLWITIKVDGAQEDNIVALQTQVAQMRTPTP